LQLSDGMQRLGAANLNWLLSRQVAPCVTIYVDLSDPHESMRKYSELLDHAKGRLRTAFRQATPSSFLRPLYDFMREIPRLEGIEGLGVFRSRSTSGYVPLYSRPLNEAIVADTFHLEPILSLLQQTRRYLVLGLGESRVHLYLATESTLERLETFTLEPEPAPGNEPAWTHPLQGQWRLRLPAGEAAPTLDRFYGAVREKVRPGAENSGYPLILVGRESLVAKYREHDTYPATLEHPLEADVDSMSELILHDRIEAMIRRIDSERGFDLINEYIDRFERREATDSIPRVAALASQGAVRTLLVARGRKLWGILDRENGAVETREGQRDARDSDVLDEISQLVIDSGGSVLVMDPHYMPSRSPMAAILREARRAA
jgi:hypothetical protein